MPRKQEKTKKSWFPVCAEALKHLPKDRPFSLPEALLSIQAAYYYKTPLSIANLASRWKWTWRRVKKFLLDLNLQISYSQDLKKKQNQQGVLCRVNDTDDSIDTRIDDSIDTRIDDNIDDSIDQKSINFIDYKEFEQNKQRSSIDDNTDQNRDRTQIKTEIAHRSPQTLNKYINNKYNIKPSSMVLENKKENFESLLSDGEKKFLNIFEAIKDLWFWESRETDPEFRQWVLQFTQSMKRLGCEDGLIIKIIRARDIDRARKALAFTLRIKKQVEGKGGAVKSINGLFMRAYQRKQTTNEADTKLTIEDLEARKEEKKRKRAKIATDGLPPSRKEAAKVMDNIYSTVGKMKQTQYLNR